VSGLDRTKVWMACSNTITARFDRLDRGGSKRHREGQLRNEDNHWNPHPVKPVIAPKESAEISGESAQNETEFLFKAVRVNKPQLSPMKVRD